MSVNHVLLQHLHMHILKLLLVKSFLVLNIKSKSVLQNVLVLVE